MVTWWEYTSTLVLIACQYIDRLRKSINQWCILLEPWQIACYTLSIVCFLMWLHAIYQSDKPLWQRIRRGVFGWVRMLPWVKKALENEMVKLRRELEESVHRTDLNREFYKLLPDDGMPTEDIIAEAESYQKMGRFDYFGGKVSGAVYNEHSPELTKLLSLMFERYAYTNPLHPDIFPEIRKMEAEVVRMVCNLFHGGLKSCGTMTTGGTESIMLACLAYRNRAYSMGNYAPEIVVPITAHAAFDKAAEILRLRVRHVKVDSETMQADSWAIRRNINSNTCLLVGSAPSFPHGSIDPIDEISRLGSSYGIPVHVDACLGGFLLPFMEYCGFTVKAYDFRLPGVTSISCDTHKYGFCPKGTSVVMYRDAGYIHHQFFCQPDWPGGIYASPTLSGSRSGCNIALTWATLLHHGRDGYLQSTKMIIETTRTLKSLLEPIEGIRILGNPEVSVVAFTSDVFNIYNLSDKLKLKGWSIDALQNPPGVHVCLTVNWAKEGVVDKFVADVQEITLELLKSPPEATKTAAIYGMASSIPDASVVSDVVYTYLDCCYSTLSPRKDSFIRAERKESIQTPLRG